MKSDSNPRISLVVIARKEQTSVDQQFLLLLVDAKPALGLGLAPEVIETLNHL